MIELDFAAEDGGVAGEAALPETVVEDGDCVAAGMAVFLGIEAAEDGLNAQEAEEVRGGAIDVDVGGGIACAREAHVVAVANGEFFEGTVLAEPVCVVGEGDAVVAGRGPGARRR